VQAAGEIALADGMGRGPAEFNGEWTAAMSRAELGEARLVKKVVFPWGVTAIGGKALYHFDALESVSFPASCIDRWARERSRGARP
jgi:hypothetical protein